MILVLLGTVALLTAIFLYGVRVTRPQFHAVDMRRADQVDGEDASAAAEICRRAFQASTWVSV